jgi:hypothetical protein
LALSNKQQAQRDNTDAMTLLVIVLSGWMLSFDRTASQLILGELAAVNVLQELRSNQTACEPRQFIKSTDDTDHEGAMFVDDLTQFCSVSTSAKKHRALCRVLLLELIVACSLVDASRPTPMRYNVQYTSTQICAMKSVSQASAWIWKMLSTDERLRLGSTSAELCQQLTVFNETRRLAKFLYRIGSQLRRVEQSMSMDRPMRPLVGAVADGNQRVEVNLAGQPNKTSKRAERQPSVIAVLVFRPIRSNGGQRDREHRHVTGQ